MRMHAACCDNMLLINTHFLYACIHVAVQLCSYDMHAIAITYSVHCSYTYIASYTSFKQSTMSRLICFKFSANCKGVSSSYNINKYIHTYVQSDLYCLLDCITGNICNCNISVRFASDL